MPAGPLGYRALLDRGFTAEKPPEDFRKALANIIQETVAFWCEQFVDAGIPAEKLYPHVAAPAPIEIARICPGASGTAPSVRKPSRPITSSWRDNRWWKSPSPGISRSSAFRRR